MHFNYTCDLITIQEQPPTKEQTDPNNAPNQQPPQQAGGPPPQDNEVKKGEDSENTDNIKVEDNGEKEFKEENDLASLLKRIEAAVQSGGDPKALIDEWIKEKETVCNNYIHTFVLILQI